MITPNETELISEPARQLKVAGKYDVIVAGGGLAGVAAAVAAARMGVSVCLIDKAFALGGLATLGQVTVWLPLCDGYGRQVTAGLSEEMLRLSVADLTRDNSTARFLGIPPAWLPSGDLEERKKARYRVQFNPTSYMLALEKWLLDAGVKLIYDTRLCGLHHSDDKITHIIIENKGGRMALQCGTLIDATGDADVCFLAGEPTESLNGNVRAGWFYSLHEDGLKLNAMTKPYSKDGGQNEKGGPFFRGDDPDQITEQLVGSRQMALDKIDSLRANRPGEEVQVFNIPQLPCFRMTRRLAAPFAMADSHRHQWFEDTVGIISDWRKAGPIFPVPMRSIVAPKHRNLLAAGRCMSADTSVWDVTRCFPGVCVTGESAGIAAALAVRETHGDVHNLPVEKVQARVRETGGLLDPQLMEPAEEYQAVV
jgi:hypothetical protein